MDVNARSGWGQEARAGGVNDRRISKALRYAVAVILPLLLALLALFFLAFTSEVSGAEHPFGEAGSARRAAVETETGERLRLAYHYAFWWARSNSLEIPDRIPAAVFCRDADDIARRTDRPASERGGVVVSRADIQTGTIYLSRTDPHDLYHECYHVMFRSVSEVNAEAFAAWCVKMDAQLEALKREEGRRQRRGDRE